MLQDYFHRTSTMYLRLERCIGCLFACPTLLKQVLQSMLFLNCCAVEQEGVLFVIGLFVTEL